MGRSTETKKARILQRQVGKGGVSYSTCLRLLREHGFDEAKRQIEELTRAAEAELEGAGIKAREHFDFRDYGTDYGRDRPKS